MTHDAARDSVAPAQVSMSDFPKKKRGMGKPNPPPLLPPLDRAASPLGGILGEQLEDVLAHLDDVLGDCHDAAEAHPDPGKSDCWSGYSGWSGDSGPAERSNRPGLFVHLDYL
jgi:hypothetical protein